MTTENVMHQAKTAFRSITGSLASNIITIEDLRTAICITGRNPSLEQCRNAWDSAEAGDEVDFTEFCQIIAEMPRPTKADLINSFRALDEDHNGYLDLEEFTKLLTQSGKEKMTKQEVLEIFESADADSDGRLDYEEFCAMMMSTIQKCDDLEVNQLNSQKKAESVNANNSTSENERRPPVPTVLSASDYDTELIYSEIDNPSNSRTSDKQLQMMNLLNTNSGLNQAEPLPQKRGFLGKIFKGKSGSKENLSNIGAPKIDLPLDLVRIKQMPWANQTKNPFPSKNPWSPPKSLNTIMLPSYSGLCQIVPVCLVVPRSTEVCIAVRNLFIGKSNGNFSNNKKERVALNSSSD